MPVPLDRGRGGTSGMVAPVGRKNTPPALSPEFVAISPKGPSFKHQEFAFAGSAPRWAARVLLLGFLYPILGEPRQHLGEGP
jgi:hypothetical protein